MKKILEIINTRFTGIVLYLLGVITLTIMAGYSLLFVFVDIVIFEGFMLAVICLFVLLTLFGFVNYIISAFNLVRNIQNTKYYLVANIVSAVSILIFLALDIFFLSSMGQSMIAILCAIKEIIIYPVIAIAIGLILLIVNETRRKGAKIIGFLTISIAVLLAILNIFVSFKKFEITSDPAVFDNGIEYNIVFASSDTSIGYVEIIKDGECNRIYDCNNGKKIDNKIHTISISYQDLDGAEYRVGAIRTIVQYGYGGKLGKEVTSQEYNFFAPKGDNIKAVSISDWHTDVDGVKDAVENIDDYNVVFFLGDGSGEVDYQEEIIEYYINVAGAVSKGEMPVIYVRGNHDTRGKQAEMIPSYFGYDELYYQVKVGDYSFIVLDGTEDKEDSHREYGGYNNFYQQRVEQTEWLESLENDGNSHIVLSHIGQIAREEELSKRIYQKLCELDTKIVICGHTHEVRLSNDDDEYIPRYEDGGETDGEYWCSEIVLSGDQINIYAVSDEGEKVYQGTIG